MTDELLLDFKESIYDRIYTKAQEDMDKEFPFRHHLGASILGHSCERFLFYSFRWVQRVVHASRTLRIFERGHSEEDNLINILRGAGLTIFTVDPNTGVQYRAPNLPSHIGGSMDGILAVPEHLKEVMGSDFIPVECKSHNQASANKTFKNDLAEKYPEHFVQSSIYAEAIGANYCLYVGLNKNTDEIYIEIVKVSRAAAIYHVRRGIDIVNTHVAQKLAKTPQKWRCNMCNYKETCQKKLPASHRNCRSCQHFMPQDDGTWHCTRHNLIVPKYEEITTAAKCTEWVSII